MAGYNPRQAYHDRKTPAARRGDMRRSGSAHSNQGGHDSNYNDKPSGNRPDNSPRTRDK